MKLDNLVSGLSKNQKGFFGLLPYFGYDIKKLEKFLMERTSLYNDFQKQRTCFLEVSLSSSSGLLKWRFNSKVLDLINDDGNISFFFDVSVELHPKFYDEFKYWLNSLIDEEDFGVQFLNPTTNPLNVLYSNQPTLFHVAKVNGQIALNKKTMDYNEMDRFFISQLKKYEIH